MQGQSDRPKVLLLGPSTLAVSGVSTHVRQIMASGISADFDLIHFQVGSEGKRETALAKGLRFFLSPILLAIVIVRNRIDIVHINTSLNFKAFWRDLVYLFVAKLASSKTVYQVHGGTLDTFLRANRVRRAAVRVAFSLAEAVVVLSEAERHAYSCFTSRPGVWLIPNAIDIDEYIPVASGNERNRQLVLRYLGRLDREKGLFEALTAMQILRDESGVGNVELQIAGTGPAEQELKERIAVLDLGKCVQIVGPLFGAAKIRFLQDADMLVFPSYHEGLPYVILESMAVGTPVLATSVGAIPEVVDNGVHGILVEPRDAIAIANGIQSVLKDRSTLQAMAEACVKRARERYSISRLERQLRELYGSLLA